MAFCAATTAGSVRLDVRDAMACLRTGVERLIRVTAGFVVVFLGGDSGETEALVVCASVLGVYGAVSTALRLAFSGTFVADDFLNGETKGFARVFVASWSLRRLTASGEDMFLGQSYALEMVKDETRLGDATNLGGKVDGLAFTC